MKFLTQREDNNRSGLYSQESILNVKNVKKESFGKLKEFRVDGSVYAQPLVASKINIGSSTVDLLIVATMHNSVYAFDVTSDEGYKQLWRQRLITNKDEKLDKKYWGYSIQLPHPDIGRDPEGTTDGQPWYKDISWEVGILSTPVIDIDDKLIYVVSTNQSHTGLLSDPSSTITHTLWKRDLITGEDKGHTQIAATVSAAQGTSTSTSTKTFKSNRHIQRAALAIHTQGTTKVVYVAFAGYNDQWDWQGWILGYEINSIKSGNGPTYTFCTEPDPEAHGSGIWQAGTGPAVDSNGSLYVATGNGYNDKRFLTDKSKKPVDEAKFSKYGCTVLKLSSDLKKDPLSSFKPSDSQQLSEADSDLGSGGVLLIPEKDGWRPLAVTGGKTSIIYVMKKDNLEDPEQLYNINLTAAVDSGAHSHDTHNHIHGTPTYYQNSIKMEYIYVWPERMNMMQLSLTNIKVAETATSKRASFALTATSKIRGPDTLGTGEPVPGGNNGMPGGFMTVSCNQVPATADSGIVWANHPWTGNANQAVRPGVLYAFNADNIETPIWSSRKVSVKENVAGDDVGNFAKFCCPTVANGRVYQASMGGLQQLDSQKIGFQTKWSPHLANLSHQNKGPLMMLAWTAASDGTVKTLTSTSGLEWVSDATSVPTATSQLPPSVAYDSHSGTTYITWVDKSSSTLKMKKALDDSWRKDPGVITAATWSNATDILNLPTTQVKYGPAITCGSGKLVLTWVENNTGFISVKSTNDGGANWVDAPFNTALLGQRPCSRGRPWLACNPSSKNFVLAWPDQTSGKLNFLEFTDVANILFGNTITLDDKPPVRDSRDRKTIHNSPQQQPDRVSPPDFGIAIDFVQDFDENVQDKTHASRVVPVIAFVTQMGKQDDNGIIQTDKWWALNSAVSDNENLVALRNLDFSTRYRLYKEHDIGQKASAGPSLCYFYGHMFIAWVFDESTVNVGILNRGSVSMYGLIPTTKPPTKPPTQPLTQPAAQPVTKPTT